MKKWTLLFLMGWTGLLSGQTFDRLPVGFIKNGTTLANPTTGGLNAPQLNAVDLDDDGITDLYIFDRIGNVHLPFLNVGTNDAPDYRFAPQYVPYFPPDVGNFVLLRDFNGDGAMDLFGHANQLTAPTSVKVFRGFYENGHLDFERMVFDSTDFLPFRDGVTNFRTLEIAEPDYPAFDDMDGDGDMDILTFDLTGAHVLFYRNMSQEEGFGNEKLLFDLADDCWGRFLEDMTSPDLILSGNIDECATGLTGGGTGDDRAGGLHPGSTLLTLDADQNGLTDLILGDIATPHLTLLSNFGTTQTAWITAQDGNFPNYNVPVEIPDFPSVFWLDLDGDGRRDLAAAPNNKNQTPNVEVIWRYKNTGSNEAPVFELQQKDFLTETMIDFGTGANPAFADVNADGLWDLVVGNETYFTGDGAGKDARLHLFLNVGTKSAPVFELTDDNWLNFKQFSDAGSFGFSPAFGDLDNDGDADLVVGEKDGFLFFVENTAGAGAPMSFGAPQFGWMGIDAGQFATPQIADLNRDGLMDLIIGRHGRQVQYYQNQGTPGAPFFDPDKNNPPNIAELGGMMAESIIPQVFTSTAFGAPTVLDFGDAFKILLGSDNGKIKLYDHIENNLDGTFDLLTETFGNTKEGFRIRQAAADLNDDGFLDLVVGNFRGGLSFFSTNLATDGIISATQQFDNQLFVKIFPNPADQFIRLEKTGADASPMRVRVFNSMGVNLAERFFYSDEMTFETSRWPAGFYYIQMEQNGFIFTQKIALHH